MSSPVRRRIVQIREGLHLFARWLKHVLRPPETSPHGEQLASLSDELLERLVAVDVGCRWGPLPDFSQLGSKVELIGFDADTEECDKIGREYAGSARLRLMPVALSSQAGLVTLHVTRDPGRSSIFQPDPHLREILPSLAEFEEVDRKEISTTTLDAVLRDLEAEEVDFLKLDVQGAELGVLQGANQALSHARAILTEVEFNRMYLDQPLFHDIDAHMRSKGFQLWRLGNLTHYSGERMPLNTKIRETHVFDSGPVTISHGGGQLYWGEALYVRTEIARGLSRSWRVAAKDLVIFSCLGAEDLAASALDEVLRSAPAATVAGVRALTQ